MAVRADFVLVLGLGMSFHDMVPRTLSHTLTPLIAASTEPKAATAFILSNPVLVI